jgi:REP element-mobilizing transposase RayT
MELVHFTQATEGRRAIAVDEDERRRLVSALARTAGARLLMFCLVDDHLHAALRGARLGLLVRDLRRLLRRRRPDLELEPAHVKPVRTRSHLTSLLDYLLRQPQKHELAGVHPALFGGSCFQDLVGVRLLAGFDTASFRAELPRVSLRDLLPRVGLAAEALEPASDDELRRAGPVRLVELAAATLGVGPALSGRPPTVVRARALSARLAARVGFTPGQLATPLGVDVRSVQRLTLDAREDHRGERALRRRLSLEKRALGRTALPLR